MLGVEDVRVTYVLHIAMGSTDLFYTVVNWKPNKETRQA